MSMLKVGRLSRHVITQRLAAARDTVFGKYLLLTNTGICMASSGLGDYLQQQYERLRGRADSLDRVRFRRIVGSAVVIGPACHFWYQWLDRHFPGVTLRTISRKVLLDQLIFSPVNISLFLVLIGIQEGLARGQIWTELREKGWTLFKAEWVVWPPAQFVNFYFLPTRYRVLFDSTVSLFFDYYYSYVKFSKKEETSDDQCEISRDQNDQNSVKDQNSLKGSVHLRQDRPVVNHHRWKNYMFMYMDDNHHSFALDD